MEVVPFVVYNRAINPSLSSIIDRYSSILSFIIDKIALYLSCIKDKAAWKRM